MILDLARDPSGTDGVSDVEGRVQQDHDAGGEVAHGLLEREADHEVLPEACEELADGDPQRAEGEQEAEEQDDAPGRETAKRVSRSDTLMREELERAAHEALGHAGHELREQHQSDEDHRTWSAAPAAFAASQASTCFSRVVR